ncbi:hypothetical protein [Dyadobacter sp. CY351]|uniref:hypothetical protein n=1 Tax=Dyadobacter sp. CY351 TaxID=2909337 RepID=UPI001F2B4FA7|nr:hypothetical protein [Dyadobacter sp. CY351]MCF2518426.1 hypothetical protein [Dyadobacter sp. CY351]
MWIKRIINRLWESPTATSWMSYSTRALSLFIVLPLLLKNFGSAEIALWYLFSTIIALQGLLDMGFKVTFVRCISFAMAGATNITDVKISEKSDRLDSPNWELVGDIYASMKYVYKYLALILFVVLSGLGTWSMVKPISFVNDASSAWMAWLVIICVSTYRLHGTVYANYLEGLNKIALVRRWEAITSICSIISSIIVLIFVNDLLYLVIANQAWVAISVIRNAQLSKYVEDRRLVALDGNKAHDKALLAKIWPTAWKSGLSGFMSNGLNNLTSIAYAQIGDSSSVAAYLLALRLISQIREISMAPFYSKIPLMSRLRMQEKLTELTQLAQKGMFLSHLVFVVGVVIIGFGSNVFLELIDSKIEFVSGNLWLLISLAYFIHRYGAMHMQLYMTTNHVIAHIADGISGLIFVVVTAVLLKPLQLYAIPIGMISGYLGFYSWYSAYYSFKSLRVNYWKFEARTIGLPLVLFLIQLLVQNIKF